VPGATDKTFERSIEAAQSTDGPLTDGNTVHYSMEAPNTREWPSLYRPADAH
jgi:hypothetical protein